MSDIPVDNDSMPNGFRELSDEERNPIESPRPYEIDKLGRRMCGAKKRNGEPCRGPALANGRCRIHGGLTPGGVASPHYKHGRRSRYLKDLPSEVRAGYRAGLKDPDLHSMNDEMAALQSRLPQLFRSLNKTNAPPWGKAVDASVNCEQAKRSGDKAKAKRAYAELSKFIRTDAEAAQSHEGVWANILEVISIKGKTAQAEHRREVDLG
jgi:hypothetical protein